MRRPGRFEQGVTLVISLVFLLILTLFALAMIRMSGTNVNISGNTQIQQVLAANAQQAIEGILNSSNFYTDVINVSGWWTGGATTHDVTVNGYTVTLNKPKCLSTRPSVSYSQLTSLVFYEDTFWEVEATATDALTGATVDLVQGVTITLPTGSCVWP